MIQTFICNGNKHNNVKYLNNVTLVLESCSPKPDKNGTRNRITHKSTKAKCVKTKPELSYKYPFQWILPNMDKCLAKSKPAVHKTSNFPSTAVRQTFILKHHSALYCCQVDLFTMVKKKNSKPWRWSCNIITNPPKN